MTAASLKELRLFFIRIYPGNEKKIKAFSERRIDRSVNILPVEIFINFRLQKLPYENFKNIGKALLPLNDQGPLRILPEAGPDAVQIYLSGDT